MILNGDYQIYGILVTDSLIINTMSPPFSYTTCRWSRPWVDIKDMAKILIDKGLKSAVSKGIYWMHG